MRLDPVNAAGLTSRGNIFYAKQDYDRAIADFSEVLRLDPRNPAAYVGRGKRL
jgi:tetratricopeptide (TPR) repeat protein